MQLAGFVLNHMRAVAQSAFIIPNSAINNSDADDLSVAVIDRFDDRADCSIGGASQNFVN